jgi:hypothetical protein
MYQDRCGVVLAHPVRTHSSMVWCTHPLQREMSRIYVNDDFIDLFEYFDLFYTLPSWYRFFLYILLDAPDDIGMKSPFFI